MECADQPSGRSAARLKGQGGAGRGARTALDGVSEHCLPGLLDGFSGLVPIPVEVSPLQAEQRVAHDVVVAAAA